MSKDSLEVSTTRGGTNGARIRTASIRCDAIGTGSIGAPAISTDRIEAEKISADSIRTAKISARPIVTLPTIPTRMRAAVYRGIDDMRVETVPVPLNADGTLSAGEVLVRIDTCGICGTDLKKIHTGSHSAPRIFGHEMAGTVAMVGEGVTQFAVGDRVMAYHHVPCGECYYCRKRTYAQCEMYQRVGCTAGFAPSGGGFAEYIRVSEWIVGRPGKTAGLIRIPDDIPFEQAAFIEPVNTCYKAVRRLDLNADETVLVIGQGPIGILLAALARRTGATVLTSDLYAERHAVAAKFGLDRPILSSAGSDVAAVAKTATEGRGADVVMVAVGVDALIRTAMDAVRPGGRVMLFASTQRGEAGFDPAAVCMDEKTLMGSYSSSVDVNDEVAELVFAGYRDGSFDLTQLISHRFALKDAVEAIDLASHPQAGSMKTVIKMQAVGETQSGFYPPHR
jgi:L-iditol 2-dehydrogenase